MASLKTGTTIGGQVAWHAGNDGAGSGLDADTIDGYNGSQFAPSQVGTAAPAVRAVGDIYIDSDSWSWDYDGQWQYPLLINGWANYGAPWGPARYRKTFSGIVVMEGLVRSGNGVILVIPWGYRPQYHFLTATIGGGNWGSRIQVSSDGAVVPTLGANATNGYYSLCCWWYGMY